MTTLDPETKKVRVKRYEQEVARLRQLIAMRERKVERAKAKLADAQDRLALAKKGRE